MNTTDGTIKFDPQVISLRKRIAELEDALDRIRRVHPNMTKPASDAFFECQVIADRALRK